MNLNINTTQTLTTAQKIAIGAAVLLMLTFFVYAGITIHARGW